MKKRIISAIVALLIFIPLIYFGGISFKIAVTILSIIGMWELLRMPSNNKRPKYVDVILYALVMILTYVDVKRNAYIFLAILLPSLAVIYCNNNKKYNADDAFKYIGMTFLIGLVFHEVVALRDKGLPLFIYVFIIPFINDMFAQLGGMLIGSHKLAPKISPKKTIEGSITGLVFGTLIPVTYYYICVDTTVNILGLVVITVFLSCLGQLGDLFFSCVKRNHNIKDFSNIMPGHGGVLDRLDSIIFVIIGYILLSGII